MKLKNRKKYLTNKKIKLVMFLLITLIFFVIFNKIFLSFSNYLINYAEAETTKLSSIVINNSVTDESSKKLDFSNMYHITKNESNEIEMVDYNSVIVNEFLNDVSLKIQEDLLDLEKETLFYMPLGSISNNPLFNHLGPNIPVKLKLISSVLTNINIRVREYGINNSLIEMVILVEVKTKIILPLISKDIMISNEVPISYKIINGKIPNYYGEGINKNSNIYSLPLE